MSSIVGTSPAPGMTSLSVVLKKKLPKMSFSNAYSCYGSIDE